MDSVAKNFGRSIIDFPHVFSFSSIWEVPYGRGKKFGTDLNKWANGFIGGWELTPIFRMQSGRPFDIRDNHGNLVDVTGDPYSGKDSPYLNWAAFTQVPEVSGTAGTIPARVGNMLRNSLRAPMSWSLNLGVAKNFAMTETAKLQFRFQAYNLTNQPQRVGLSTWLGDRGATAPPSSWGLWYENYQGAERKLEFGLRLEF